MKTILARVLVPSIFTAAFAVGCAQPSDDEGSQFTESAESTHSTQEALGAGAGSAESLVLEIAKGAAKQLGMELFSFVFSSGQPKLSIEAFIQGVDASIRNALLEQAKQANVDTIAEAQLDLEKVQASARDAQKIELAKDMDTFRYHGLASLSSVTTNLGPSAPRAIREAGLRVFITAAQLQITKMQMQAALHPAGNYERDLRTVLTSDAGWIAHVVKTANDARATAANNRIGMLGNCGLVYASDRTGQRTYGFWDGGARYDETGYSDELAAARCRTTRDRHIASLNEQVSRDLDAQQKFVFDVVEQWETLARSLDGSAPARTFIGYDFGGMFGRGAPSGGEPVWFANPAVGGASCPAGYEADQIFGRSGVDYPVWACVRRATPTSVSFVDFTGMFGDSYYADRAVRSTNPFTGASWCTEGSWGAKLLDDRDLDNQLYACFRPHIAGTKPTFGGTFSRRGNRGNAITGGLVCPYGFAPKSTFGSQPGRGLGHEDDDLTFCWRPL